MPDKLRGQLLLDKFFDGGITDHERKSRLGKNARNLFLQASDWTQLPDIPQSIRQSYVEYRQALRDLPNDERWPNIPKTAWPQEPEA